MKENKPLERPGNRWEYNIKMNINKCDGRA